MGNVISFNGIVTKDDDLLSMSNGLTDVLIDVLLASSSELAATKSEKRMVVFLAEKQQSIVGIGTVGFDIIEIPWQIETFESDKEFLLRAIYYARSWNKWETIGHTPNLEHLTSALDTLEILINRMTVNDVDESNLREWINAAEKDDPVNCGYPKCPKHGLLLSIFGCKFCNEGL